MTDKEVEAALQWADDEPNGFRAILARALRSEREQVKRLEDRVALLEKVREIAEDINRRTPWVRMDVALAALGEKK